MIKGMLVAGVSISFSNLSIIRLRFGKIYFSVVVVFFSDYLLKCQLTLFQSQVFDVLQMSVFISWIVH